MQFQCNASDHKSINSHLRSYHVSPVGPSLIYELCSRKTYTYTFNEEGFNLLPTPHRTGIWCRSESLILPAILPGILSPTQITSPALKAIDNAIQCLTTFVLKCRYVFWSGSIYSYTHFLECVYRGGGVPHNPPPPLVCIRPLYWT